MPTHDTGHRRQAKPPAGELGGKKRIEYLGARLRVHAATVIGHRERHVTAGREGPANPEIGHRTFFHAGRGRRYGHPAALGTSGLRGVDHQIHDDLLDLGRVGLNGGQPVVQCQTHLDVLRNRGLDQPQDLPHLLGKVQRLDEEPSAPGVGQHLFGELGGPLAGQLQALHQFEGRVDPAKYSLRADWRCP